MRNETRDSVTYLHCHLVNPARLEAYNGPCDGDRDWDISPEECFEGRVLLCHTHDDGSTVRAVYQTAWRHTLNGGCTGLCLVWVPA